MSTYPLLLEPEELQPLLHNADLLIIDQSSLERYLTGHVPGAVHLDFKQLQLGEQPTPGALPTIEQLNRVFSELGLTADKHVIAYDDEGGGWAGRLIWALDMIGHSRYSYLNGGIHAWLQAGLETDSTMKATQPSNYVVTSLNSRFTLTKEQVLARLKDIEDGNFAIWDARSAAEYRGEKVFAARGGHIPGAVNYEWTLGMDPTRGLRINELTKFDELLNSLGLTADKHIMTHCQTHHRSGFTYLVGKLLGRDIAAYAGSWSEWGNDANTPINTGDKP